jgi:hypothetical protein
MWDVTCDVAWRELRQAVEAGEEVDWGDYIPLGELVPPGEPAGRDQGLMRWVASAGRLVRSLLTRK